VTTPKFGVVVTTINGGGFLEVYLDHLRHFERLRDVRFYVVGDRKTPDACRASAEAARRKGLDCLYLGVEEQIEVLKDFPRLDAVVPWNSDNRRNLGFVLALRDGVDTLISIDDDNLPVSGHDFLAGHSVVGRTITGPTFSAKSGWYNLFDALEYSPPLTVWPRGFPYRLRVPAETTQSNSTALVHINAGLWLGDPDVDAVTRIAIHPDVSRMKLERGLLAPDSYSPINTQNTALHRDAIPAYYYVLMHEPMHGSRLNRFGDIWSGYFVQKCAKALGHGVAFGAPPVEQVRNEHDLFVDLREEFWGIVLTEHLSQWIVDVRLQGSSYTSLYGDLADKLLAYVRGLEHPSVNGEVHRYFAKVNGAMHAWLETIALVAR
jgi:hypothetical protein